MTKKRVSDVDLAALIRAYNAGGITHGFVSEILECLHELWDRRAADDARLGLKRSNPYEPKGFPALRDGK